MKRWMAFTLILLAMSFSSVVAAQARPIDFSDLEKATGPDVRSVLVTGIRTSARTSMDSFWEIVAEREREANERRASMPAERRDSSSKSPDDRSNATAKAATKAEGPQSFVCTVYCNSSSGPTVRHRLQAASRREAARLTGDAGESICRNKGFAKASSLSLPESQCSKE
jgi:hypothetical protein